MVFRGEPSAQDLFRVDWSKFGLPYCGIYVIGPAGQWPSKVGVSCAAAARLWHMQTAHWERIDLHWYRYCASAKAAAAVEEKTIAALQRERLRGEWFGVKPNDAISVITFSASAIGVKLLNDVPEDARIRKFLSTKRWIFGARYAEAAADIEPEAPSQWFADNEGVIGRKTSKSRAQGNSPW